MAKEKMLCPFSERLCRECPLYRGRHYYLCYCSEYRGHLTDSESGTGRRPVKPDIDRYRDVRMPQVLEPSPTWLVLDEFVERQAEEQEK